MPRGVTTAKTGSKVTMNDGTASDYQRPKSARQSVCQRATDSSTAGRNQATAHGKSSTALAFGGKLADSRGQALEGSMSRRGPSARSEVERSMDVSSFAATTASSSIRNQVPYRAACHSSRSRTARLAQFTPWSGPRLATRPTSPDYLAPGRCGSELHMRGRLGVGLA